MAQIYASKTNEIQKYETEHENEVRHLAGECMVLLENDGVLPFSDKIKKIALYGTGARHTVKGGTGSGDVNVRKTVSIARGLEEAGFEIVTEDWLDRYDRDLEEAQKTYLKKLKDMSDETGEPSVILGFKHPFQEPEQPIVEETDIKEADAAIYVLARNSGEGKDRRAEKGDYYLSDRELFELCCIIEYRRRDRSDRIAEDFRSAGNPSDRTDWKYGWPCSGGCLDG